MHCPSAGSLSFKRFENAISYTEHSICTGQQLHGPCSPLHLFSLVDRTRPSTHASRITATAPFREPSASRVPRHLGGSTGHAEHHVGGGDAVVAGSHGAHEPGPRGSPRGPCAVGGQQPVRALRHHWDCCRQIRCVLRHQCPMAMERTAQHQERRPGLLCVLWGGVRYGVTNGTGWSGVV